MCSHPDVEPVTLVTGETVAMVCIHCMERLPAEWGCDECSWVDITRLGSASPEYALGAPCDDHSRVDYRNML